MSSSFRQLSGCKSFNSCQCAYRHKPWSSYKTVWRTKAANTSKSLRAMSLDLIAKHVGLANMLQGIEALRHLRPYFGINLKEEGNNPEHSILAEKPSWCLDIFFNTSKHKMAKPSI